jgi:hypothetical protein
MGNFRPSGEAVYVAPGGIENKATGVPGTMADPLLEMCTAITRVPAR